MSSCGGIERAGNLCLRAAAPTFNESTIATAGRSSFRLEASQPRRVADEYLVSFETNRYSVPFTLIGQTVEVTKLL